MIHAIAQAPNLPVSEKETERINDDVDTIVGAGLETVAAILRFIIFYVYHDTKILERLRAELSEVPKDATLSVLEQQNYLTSVIMEGLRLMPGIATRSARIAPDRDLVYDGKWVIPPGTPVGMTTILMHNDKNSYPDPQRFVPDRWTKIEGRRKAGKTFAPFSRGTRICLGMHLAWAELYMTLARIVQRYDFEFVGTTAEDVDPYSDQFIIGTKSKAGVKVVARHH